MNLDIGYIQIQYTNQHRPAETMTDNVVVILSLSSISIKFISYLKQSNNATNSIQFYL